MSHIGLILSLLSSLILDKWACDFLIKNFNANTIKEYNFYLSTLQARFMGITNLIEF